MSLEKGLCSFCVKLRIMLANLFNYGQLLVYIIGCGGASQLGGPFRGTRQGYKANKLKSHYLFISAMASIQSILTKYYMNLFIKIIFNIECLDINHVCPCISDEYNKTGL